MYGHECVALFHPNQNRACADDVHHEYEHDCEKALHVYVYGRDAL